MNKQVVMSASIILLIILVIFLWSESEQHKKLIATLNNIKSSLEKPQEKIENVICLTVGTINLHFSNDYSIEKITTNQIALGANNSLQQNLGGNDNI